MGGQDGWSGALVNAATDRLSLVLGLVGIGLAFLFYHTVPSTKVPLWVAASLVIFAFGCLFIALHALKTVLVTAGNKLPKLLAVVVEASGQRFPILLLEPNELFGTESVVSIYNRDESNGFEVLIGYGSVLTVQTDRKIQVQVTEWMEGSEESSEKICQQNVEAMRTTIIKPNTPKKAGARFVTQAELINVLEALGGRSEPEEVES